MAHPPELRERAKELRARGLLIRVIADDLGVPEPTVVRWLNPALEQRERTKAQKRKFSRKRHCPKCSRKMSNTAALCQRCRREASSRDRYWTRERIIDAIRVWAIQHGHAPTAKEWESSGRGHPAISTILDGPSPPFRRWSEALLAAGFEPRKHRSNARMMPAEKMALRRKRREDALKRALAKENNGNQGEVEGRP